MHLIATVYIVFISKKLLFHLFIRGFCYESKDDKFRLSVFFFYLLHNKESIGERELLGLGWMSYSLVPHIPVTHCSHGNDSPPKSVRDGFEVGILRARLGKVDGTRE